MTDAIAVSLVITLTMWLMLFDYKVVGMKDWILRLLFWAGVTACMITFVVVASALLRFMPVGW